MSPARIITDEELLQLPKDGHKYEVVDGELVVSPVGFWHDVVVASDALYALPGGNKGR